MAEAADRDPAPGPGPAPGADLEPGADRDPESHEGPLTIYLVKQLELAIRSFMDEALRPFGLTTFQYTALTVLQHRGTLSSAQLARRSFVRPQTMHEIVRSLEERGLIERAHAPGNRRTMEARLTGRGRNCWRRARRRCRSWRTGCCSACRRSGGPRSVRAWRTGSSP